MVYLVKLGDGSAEFTIGSLKAGRSGNSNSNSLSIPFKVREDGSIQFDIDKRDELEKKDKKESTVVK